MAVSNGGRRGDGTAWVRESIDVDDRWSTQPSAPTQQQSLAFRRVRPLSGLCASRLSVPRPFVMTSSAE
ncbi:hypothetical protein PENTCL1PPCAC_9218, partial [Pristionchus entomophagus]